MSTESRTCCGRAGKRTQIRRKEKRASTDLSGHEGAEGQKEGLTQCETTELNAATGAGMEDTAREKRATKQQNSD